jgi:VTC domain
VLRLRSTEPDGANPMTHTRTILKNAAELKFIVDAQMGERIRTWARTFLEPDPYGTGPSSDEYWTTTLYYDTADLDVLYRRGSFGRAKYRIRRYDGSDLVFLERKLRRPGILAKRRTQVPIEALNRLDCLGRIEAWPGTWFQHRVSARALAPACQVIYHRMARVAATPAGPARLTLDESLHSIAVSGVRFSAEPGLSLLSGRLILELKFRPHLPVIFKRLIEAFGLSPHAVSKYRLGMREIAGLAPDHTFVSPVAGGPIARA